MWYISIISEICMYSSNMSLQSELDTCYLLWRILRVMGCVPAAGCSLHWHLSSVNFELQCRAWTHPRNRWKVRQRVQRPSFSLFWYIPSCSELTSFDGASCCSGLFVYPGPIISSVFSSFASFCRSASLLLVDIKLTCMGGRTFARSASWQFNTVKMTVFLKVPLFMQ